MNDSVGPPPGPSVGCGKSSAVARRDNGQLSGFLLLMVSDLLARSGYQMGKSPLLPLFASALGASTPLSGMIVAVSTATGLITSPLIGTLSDMHGRRRLLLLGTAIFSVVPLAYLFIQTPAQLLGLRLVHGFGTAIYGPVVAASVADLYQSRRAGYMGWYGSVRTASYMLGPLLGGFVLFIADFRTAWVAVSVTGVLALIPVLVLKKTSPMMVRPARRGPSLRTWHSELSGALRNPRLLMLGLIEAAMYLGLRANKAFLPLYAVSAGLNAAQVGIIFSIQVASTLVAQPGCGHLADRVGRRPLVIGGLLAIASALPLFVLSKQLTVMIGLGVILGLGEAAILPPVMALGTELSSKEGYGSTLGMLDAMDNLGKALGPVLAGLMLSFSSYLSTFIFLALLLLILAVGIAIFFHDDA